MAQKLFIKVTNPDGTTGQKEINVIRSWQESDGRQIFLHTNGVYGYKDESPVLKKEDLNIISDPTQHRLALNWWDRTGKEMSAGFYDAREKEIERRQLEGVPVPVDGDVSNLDAMVYIRRPVKDKRKKAFSEASTWPEFGFKVRPEWWGNAGMIELGAYHYEKEEAEEPEDTDQKPETGDQKSEEAAPEEGTF